MYPHTGLYLTLSISEFLKMISRILLLLSTVDGNKYLNIWLNIRMLFRYFEYIKIYIILVFSICFNIGYIQLFRTAMIHTSLGVCLSVKTWPPVSNLKHPQVPWHIVQGVHSFKQVLMGQLLHNYAYRSLLYWLIECSIY